MNSHATRTHLVVPFLADTLDSRASRPAPTPVTKSTLTQTPSKTLSTGRQQIICIKRRNSQYGSSSSLSGTKRPRIFEDEDSLCQSPEPMDESSPELSPRHIKRSRSNDSLSTASSIDEPKTPRMQINDQDLIEADADVPEDLLDPLHPSSSTTSPPPSRSTLSIPPRSDEHAILDDFLCNLVKNADIIKQNAQALRVALSHERSCKLYEKHVNGRPCICRANTSLSVLNQYKRRQRELRLPLLETLVQPGRGAELRRMQTPVIHVEEVGAGKRGVTV